MLLMLGFRISRPIQYVSLYSINWIVICCFFCALLYNWCYCWWWCTSNKIKHVTGCELSSPSPTHQMFPTTRQAPYWPTMNLPWEHTTSWCQKSLVEWKQVYYFMFSFRNYFFCLLFSTSCTCGVAEKILRRHKERGYGGVHVHFSHLWLKNSLPNWLVSISVKVPHMHSFWKFILA